MRPPIEDPVETEGGLQGETIITHPAFAQIRASRCSGEAVLYGSELRHHAFVTVSISRSVVHRGLSRFWYMGGDEIISVRLSEAQWATFVTAMNVGSGVPCTIEHVHRVSAPRIPASSSVPRFRKEIADVFGTIAAKIAALREKLPNARRKELDLISQEIDSNLPFVAKQFDAHMEEGVEAAKAEVNAHATHIMFGLGAEALESALQMRAVTLVEGEEIGEEG